MDAAWSAVVDVAARVDLDAPTRLPGWSARDVLVHLGSWGAGGTVAERVAAHAGGVPGAPADVEARNALLVAAHHDAPRREVVAALERGRDRAAAFLLGPQAEDLGRRWVQSPVGDLPATGVLVGQAYELAVHALDLAPAGVVAADLPDALLDAGVAALVDVTGALAARAGVSTTFAVLTPIGRWASGAVEGAWTTVRLGAGPAPAWPSVAGTAADVLDASAGRVIAVQLVLTRRLRLHRAPGLVALLPALQAAPGLPGGTAAQATLRTLAQTGRLVGRWGTDLGSGVARAVRGR